MAANKGQPVSLEEDTLKFGIRAVGRAEYRDLRAGKRLTQRKLIRAMHYHCMCGYQDGVCDCFNVLCPLHETHPYKGVPSPLDAKHSQEQSTRSVSTTTQSGGCLS